MRVLCRVCAVLPLVRTKLVARAVVAHFHDVQGFPQLSHRLMMDRFPNEEPPEGLHTHQTWGITWVLSTAHWFSLSVNASPYCGDSRSVMPEARRNVEHCKRK